MFLEDNKSMWSLNDIVIFRDWHWAHRRRSHLHVPRLHVPTWPIVLSHGKRKHANIAVTWNSRFAFRQLCFIVGLCLTIGPMNTLAFFMRKSKIKGSAFFFSGLFLLTLGFFGFTTIAIVVQLWGLVLLFRYVSYIRDRRSSDGLCLQVFLAHFLRILSNVTSDRPGFK